MHLESMVILTDIQGRPKGYIPRPRDRLQRDHHLALLDSTGHRRPFVNHKVHRFPSWSEEDVQMLSSIDERGDRNRKGTVGNDVALI